MEADKAWLAWPFKPSPLRAAARALAAMVSERSRQPDFYGPERAPDTLEGRLEILMLHAALLFMRLRRAPEHAPLAAALADVLFREIDAGLREAGVGDLSVPRRMRKIAGQFYGRLAAYEAALADAPALGAALARNIPLTPGAPFTAALAVYAQAAAAALAQAPVEADSLRIAWPTPP
ncbi:MAG: ubiquinol-cytochrome C chaperone family protein [Hyphomonadaceae bacterium]